MNLDEKLLEEERTAAGPGNRAGGLREAQRAGSDGTRAAKPDDFREDRGASMSLREIVRGRQKQAASASGEGEEEVSSMASKAINKGTSNLLSQSWKHLIDSWGTTLLWIDIHWMLSYIMGEKLFRKLDHSVADVIIGDDMSGASVAGAAAGGAPGVPGVGKSQTPRSGECCLAAGCNLGCLFIVLAAIGIIAMMIGVITNPLEAISALLSGIWGAITE